MLAGKSRGGTPFCRTLKIGFPKSNVSCETTGNPLQLFHRNSYKIVVCCSGFTRQGGLVRPASKSCRFSHHPLRVPKAWHRNFAACGQRSGLLAHTSPTFLKNCWSKKLFVCLWLVIGNLISRKTIRIRFGKAGAHPQLAWESQLPPKPCSPLQPSAFEGNCDSSDLLLDFCYSFICKFDLLRKCGLLAHTSAAFLKNCCTEKLFGCLRQKNCRQFDLAATSFDFFCSYFI